MREACVKRTTNETAVTVKLEPKTDFNSRTDGNGVIKGSDIYTGIGFFNHMLDLFAFRAGLYLTVECAGDWDVDGHHTVEDVGITLGQALASALGDKNGINRYAEAAIPMDESLARCTLDISGRPYLVFNASFPDRSTGAFDTSLTEEFFRAVAVNAGFTLHINLVYGKNTHHMIEAIFKAFGCALRQAAAVTGEGIPSTKGVL